MPHLYAIPQTQNSANEDVPYAKYVTLKHPLKLSLTSASLTTEAEKAEIKELVGRLASISQPDICYSIGDSGYSFSPLPEFATSTMLFMGRPQTQVDPSVARLTHFGPKAIPLLLAHLDDSTPTQLTVTLSRFLTFKSQRELLGNPLHASEKPFLSRASTSPIVGLEKSRSYTVTVGDVCFVILGQIVGRPYSAVRYQPSGLVIINSPCLDPVLRNALRRMWGSENPRKHLFDSLLTDYATQGVFNGESLDGWDIGSDFQIQAILRLLYYFPSESVPLIVKRLNGLRVRLPYRTTKGREITEAQTLARMKREVANGARTDELIRAACWCPNSRIQKAIARIAHQTDDPDIRKVIR